MSPSDDGGHGTRQASVNAIHVSRQEGVVEASRDDVAGEYPLTLFVNEREMATLVCTPTNLEELVRGFLTAEGVLDRSGSPARVFVDREEGHAHVEAPDQEDSMARAMFATRYVGSCCGKSRTGFYFANDARTARVVDVDYSLSVEDGFRLMDRLQGASSLHQRTGGVHNAGLATLKGLDVVRTDIGRHNTLDKLYGHALSEDLDLTRRLIVFSGRLSSEIILKVSKMGCPVILSSCAPTELGLRMADDLGLTTVGFLRDGTANLYTHPERFEDVRRDASAGSPHR